MSKSRSNPPDEIPDEEFVPVDDVIIGKAFRFSIAVVVLVGGGIAAGIWALRRPRIVPPPVETTIAPPQVMNLAAEAPHVRFTDVTDQAGIDFVHENGAFGDKLLPETMGAGCAFFDYDNDGDPDLLLVNSNVWPGRSASEKPPPTMALYRNDGTGRFENVTTEASLDVSFYGTGAAIGDYDNDGWVDLFIAAVGPNRLFRNQQGRFKEVTAAARVAGGADQWSTSSGFADYDNDGDLDLFVCNYVRWSRKIDCAVDYRLLGVGRAYGPPMNFEGTHPYLYRNNGDGTFEEVGAKAGLHVNNPATGRPMGKALGVAPVDVDSDGWIDWMVANDTVQNFLFHNQGDGSFVESATEMGLAFDRNGSATGAMGIDAGHFRDADSLGFFIGNFANEMTSLYVAQDTETMLFADEAIVEGIGSPSRRMLTFGLFLFDYDLDGRLDLLQANGHLEEEINVVQPSQHYEQPPQLFWNCGPHARSCLVPVDPDSTGDMRTALVGRGASYADIDGDGDLDVLLTQTGRRAVLLRNDQDLGHHWVRIRLNGTSANRDGIGARLALDVGGSTLRRQMMPTRSYLSQVDLAVTFGLGELDPVGTLHVTWPGGHTERFENLRADAVHTIVQGTGMAARVVKNDHSSVGAAARTE